MSGLIGVALALDRSRRDAKESRARRLLQRGGALSPAAVCEIMRASRRNTAASEPSRSAQSSETNPGDNAARIVAAAFFGTSRDKFHRASAVLVSQTILHTQLEGIRRVQAMRGLPWCVLRWDWDSTPQIGRRAACLDPNGVAIRSRTTSLDMLVQIGEVCWPDKITGAPRHEELLTLRTRLPDQAFETLGPLISTTLTHTGMHPRQFLSSAAIIVFCSCVDAHKTNPLVLRSLRREVNNAKAAFLATRCELHQAQHIVQFILNHFGILSPIFSLGKLLVIDTYYDRFRMAVLHIVRTRVVVVRGGRVSEACRLRNAKLVEMCLGARLSGGGRGGSAAEPHSFICTRRALGILNGDWQAKRVQHICNGCCKAGCEMPRILQAVADLLFHSKPIVICKTRWGKTSLALGWWAIGCLCHSLFPAAWACAFGSPSTPGAVVGRVGETAPDSEVLSPDFGFDTMKQVAAGRLSKGSAFLSNGGPAALAKGITVLRPVAHVINKLIELSVELPEARSSRWFALMLSAAQQAQGDIASLLASDPADPAGMWAAVAPRVDESQSSATAADAEAKPVDASLHLALPAA